MIDTRSSRQILQEALAADDKAAEVYAQHDARIAQARQRLAAQAEIRRAAEGADVITKTRDNALVELEPSDEGDYLDPHLAEALRETCDEVGKHIGRVDSDIEKLAAKVEDLIEQVGSARADIELDRAWARKSAKVIDVPKFLKDKNVA